MIAGVDEAGRGALAGPVVVAAVILDPNKPIPGLADSKKLTAGRREVLTQEIKANSLAWHVVSVDRDTIDSINILQASLVGMQQAVAGLKLTPEHVLVDGNHAPQFAVPATAIIGGDASEACIGAASILAKVQRDHIMVAMATVFPGYAFARNKGYPTAQHRQALEAIGPCSEHRRSYAPVIQASLKFPEALDD